jgi:hypothetical protein
LRRTDPNPCASGPKLLMRDQASAQESGIDAEPKKLEQS